VGQAVDAIVRPSNPFPVISIIVPTYNRAHELPYLFSALAAQWYPADRMELLVVDNSSSDQTEAVVAEWATILPFSVAFYRKDNRGPAASRNYGAERARGEVLAYTDSDCIPLPHWLRNAAAGFAQGGDMILGPFYPVGRLGEPILVSQQSAQERDKGCYPTANLFIRRSDWEKVGGFDERYGLYPWGGLVAGEDTDLAWRIRRSGAQPLFVWNAAVGHLSTPITLRKFLLRPIMVQILPALLRKVPELRQTFFWNRYFMSKYSLYFELGLIGVIAAAAIHTWVPLLLTLPWLRHLWANLLVPTTRILGLRQGLARTLLHIYGQSAETLVLIFGSIRYRRLVL
jgi:glycosyltransferase involved in cell wall biosynthesis